MADRSSPVSRDLVRTQAQAVVAVAQHRLGTAASLLTSDPCAVLRAWDEIDFRLVPSRQIPNDCSVAGAYITEDHLPRPRIMVAENAVAGRRAFTALHELAHHLQQTDDGLAGTLWAHSSIDLFEDLACDAFAAEVLLPWEIVDKFIPQEGPTAQQVVDLYDYASASRSAVCVRAAQCLLAPGHVLLLDQKGNVEFAATNRLPRIARDSDQSQVAAIRNGLQGGNSRGRDCLFYRDGITGDELYIQTAVMDHYLVAVAVTDHAPWEQFTLASRDAGPRPATYECADLSCGATFDTFDRPHATCGSPVCPDCGRCGCGSRVAERQCMTCFLMHPSATFVGDRCADCS